MIRLYVFRSVDHPDMKGIAEMFSVLDKALEPGRKSGIEHKYKVTHQGWDYWYEFETEEEAALFRLTYL